MREKERERGGGRTKRTVKRKMGECLSEEEESREVVTKKRKEGQARKKSTSEDYGNDIHFFSLSASCFSHALRAFFLSFPPSPCFSRDSPAIPRLDRAKTPGYTYEHFGNCLKTRLDVMENFAFIFIMPNSKERFIKKYTVSNRVT